MYVEVQKVIHRLPQDQSQIVHELWKYELRPIQFALIIDDFAVKYLGRACRASNECVKGRLQNQAHH